MNQNQIFTKAHELMAELEIHELPVNPFDVAEHLGIPVISYDEAQKAGFASAVDNILRGKAKADAFCYRKKGNHIIFYDLDASVRGLSGTVKILIMCYDEIELTRRH